VDITDTSFDVRIVVTLQIEVLWVVTLQESCGQILISERNILPLSSEFKCVG
jgi:hypothetical protein